MNLDAVSNIEQLLFVVVVFLGLSFVALYVSLKLSVSRFISLALLLWHFVFTLAYLFYVNNYGGDALGYFEDGGAGWQIGLGGEFVRSAVYAFRLLGMGVVPIFLIFGFVGYMGVLFLLASIMRREKDFGKYGKFFLIILFFMPSFHFWGAAIGKDAFSLCAISLVVYSCCTKQYRYVFFLFGVFLMLLVRPHMAAIMLASGFVGYIFSSALSLPVKSVIGSVFFVAGVSVMPFFFEQAGMEADAGLSDVSQYVEMRQTKNLQGGSSIDISNMSVPGRLFAYLFRPSFLDGGSLFSLISSLDNLIVFFVFIFISWRFIKLVKMVDGWEVVLVFYFVVGWVILANTTANLGISMRQKWMLLPCLYYFFFLVLSRQEKND